MEVVIASSAVDAGIGCWELHSGAERHQYRSCSSAPHGLLSVSGRFVFLAASQLRDAPSATSAPIFFWSWDKPQVEVRSFPAEPIGPLISNAEGTYIIGGGSSGSIYLWEVFTGKLLKKWHAHYRSVNCLTLAKDDESLLISGSEDGSVKVWSLIMLFDDIAMASAANHYIYSFSEHSLGVTDIVSGHGLSNSIIISSSQDRTCKVWSLSKGELLRNILFPSVIDAIAMDPGEHVFYAGGRDGKIYIAALNAEGNPNSPYGVFILDTLYDQSKGITSLALSKDGFSLVSGSEDGFVRIWNTITKQFTRVFKHGKGPINNVVIARQSPLCSSALANKKHSTLPLPPPLSKYTDSADGQVKTTAVTMVESPLHGHQNTRFLSADVMEKLIQELQNRNTSSAAEMELEKLRLQYARSVHLIEQQKKLYEDMQSVYVSELLD
ncbi:protein ROOT INITIATION DEFECTIVE 3-like [Zingiber officinale]|uniref:protein ROOT INITIATION DEFECTIVE 3-like n=1 Tax=Zingiber officinale TaxID=94328 RepID=UPI001C4C52B4|nr:protein ROOT INITIATION DEFECTIVE 3-like [Zingiber officinale]XP_042373623.1 protein ROOT INITIATION DEFECTIVE 3-like [Zingiber officinale]